MHIEPYEQWSPFDPALYREAFDKYISTADQLFNQDEIIEAGYCLPDSDGSKSSIFRRDAVLNNSFNEEILRSTLADIYLNNSHRLIASNHDEVRFYQWHIKMADTELIPNTNLCQYVIPVDSFIDSKKREPFKRNQFYRQWISITDILNNWDVFGWHVLLFINQRIYSDYEFRIDDQQVTVRFRYEQFWLDRNYSIDIYKFETKASCRVGITRQLVVNQWNWKLPVYYFTDERVQNSDKLVLTINRIRDTAIRTDGVDADILGDNLEFVTVEDGMIDLAKLSRFNRDLIMSEESAWIWLGVFVPKFLHEYPILLPVDIIYRPYQTEFIPVMAEHDSEHKYVKTHIDINLVPGYQLYVNLDDTEAEWNDGWKQLIRPIVLSDAFLANQPSPYSVIDETLEGLRKLTVDAADIVEQFRLFMNSYTTDAAFIEYCDRLEESMSAIYEAYTTFLTERRIDLDEDYVDRYNGFVSLMPEIREDKAYSVWFHKSHGKAKDFWSYVSPLIHIPRSLTDKFYISSMLTSLGDTNLWEEDNPDKVRFNRPVEPMDFWTFEYGKDDGVWRPYVLNIEHHFPDAYTLTDPASEIPTENRIFKAFFFYSDSMNVRDKAVDIVEATPSWDKDVENFTSKNAIYRDVFMEKFYWMGIKSIYKGLIVTDYRWEIIEYIQDNAAFERFNQLFLHTMDPYFKMGLATYLRSSNYMFPFDDAIDKMKESMNASQFANYNKITNFEAYLNNSWVPSYFDNVTRIMDDWSGENRLIRRPRSSFDTTRFLPTLVEVQTSISDEVNLLNDQIDWIISQLASESYGLDIDIISTLRKLTADIENNMNTVLEFTTSMDMAIYSIHDVNYINSLLANHIQLLSNIGDQFLRIYSDANRHKVYEEKQSIVADATSAIEGLRSDIDTIWAAMKTFDIDAFMKALCDPEYFDAKDHTGDTSLIGIINNFFDSWPNDVKDARNTLYVSATSLWAKYDPSKSYDTAEIDSFYELAISVKDDIERLMSQIHKWWEDNDIPVDDDIVNHAEYCINMIHMLIDNMAVYIDARNTVIATSDDIRSIMIRATEYNLSDTETTYISAIDGLLSSILEDVSYIGSTGNIERAISEQIDCASTINSWTVYLEHEQLVFERIASMSETPNPFLDDMNRYNDILNAMMEYMDTVNRDFIPDEYWPTYSDVYEVETIELVTGGYNNKVGDHAFFRGVGSFEVSEVEGNVDKASKLTLLQYRNTVFRDPCIQSLNPYDSITDGIGMGIAIKAIGSHKIRIINDEVISPYVEKVSKLSRLIRLNLDVINPYSNVAIEDDITRIRKLDSDWERLESFYYNYMSTARDNADVLILKAVELIPHLEEFNEVRSKNDLGILLTDYESFIKTSYSEFEAIGQITPNYLYFDNRLRVVYDEALEFYGNGSMWNDRDGLAKVLDDILYELNLFNRKMLINLDESSPARVMYQTLKETIESNPTVLAELDVKVSEITPLLDEIDMMVETMPEFQRDVWYNLTKIGVGYAGTGYKIGDVVEVVPELPTDSAGHPIHDQEDIIMNDVILVQVTQVTDGVVTAVEPLMSYALPYQLFGSRKTITRVGTGEGLIVNIYSVEVGLKDSKMFRDPSSDEDKLPQYDENDLFTFKFENIHDLDITYEVFFAGKQIRDFIVRHEADTNQLHPRQFDVIYLKANDVMELANSSIYQEGENYFVYKLDGVEILDPGVGYTKGQEIIVDTDQVALRLKVSSLLETPYKQIAGIETVSGNILFNDVDPTSEHAEAVKDSLNNIDDEYNSGYYDELPREGILKPASKELPAEEYPFVSTRFDNLDGKNRNEVWMHPDVDIPDTEDAAKDGDPDYHWYQGSRINEERRWNGIANVVDPADPFIPDDRRLPPNQPSSGEYQMIERAWIHDSSDVQDDNGQVESSTVVDGEEIRPRDFSSLRNINYNLSRSIVYSDEKIVNTAMNKGDLTVDSYANLPRHSNEWPAASPGKYVVVEVDETQNGHRTIYRLRTFTVTGYFIYDEPEYADYKWNYFDIDWMKTNFYPDLPDTKQMYPSTIWWTAPTYRAVQEAIQDGSIEKAFSPTVTPGTYIRGLTVADLSVYNYTTQSWEDLFDSTRWELTVRNDDENMDWGFRLTFKGEGNYSYDMRLYLNKVPNTQLKNAALKRNAVFKINASIHSEVDTPTVNTSINTGRTLRIRKLFPYQQKEEYTISADLGYKMNFKLANYIHFKNELHLEDVRIYNKTVGRFENLLDPTMFEVRFKDPKSVQRGYEKQKVIVQSIISDAGSGFVNGEVWGWNSEHKIQVFGNVTADFLGDGSILTFTPLHCPNLPEDDMTLEFKLYQHSTQNTSEAATVIIEFKTQEVEVYGDGYLHNVMNPMAPLPEEFQIICQYNLDEPTEYEISIDKSPHTWVFVEPEWIVFPTFHLDGSSIPADRIYIMTDKGRFPLVNPATGKPSMYVYQTDTGTDVKFLNIYNKYEHFEIHATPYPMRSVYTQRRVPSSGYIDLEGKLNKPLNKKYFEFWMNGRLLDDEVTIITPTKLFLHGLKSLRNFEIIEINRDQVEYFSDNFLTAAEPEYGRPYPVWDYNTYLDDALAGTLEGDNYTTDEQANLLAPVWHQVDRANPEYRNYPPNQDTEEDILLRVDDYVDMSQADAMPYQFAVVNVPSIEGVPITGRTLGFDDFGFIPMSNGMIVDMLNDEWKEEIESGELNIHTVVSDDEWYGVAARLYDEFGILVHTLDESAYYVTENNMLRITESSRLSRIVKNNVIYDLD